MHEHAKGQRSGNAFLEMFNVVHMLFPISDVFRHRVFVRVEFKIMRKLHPTGIGNLKWAKVEDTYDVGPTILGYPK